MARIPLLLTWIVLTGLVAAEERAPALPAELSDEDFWQLIVDVSEPDGHFEDENFVSNEMGYQRVMRRLQEAVQPGGVYVGVGPEQNFSYIASLRPKMALVVDIRRQNLIEHLMYKALFELSDDRADFLSRLFSRARPASLDRHSNIVDLLPAGPPTALTASRRMSTSPTWTSAGTEVLFSSGDVFTDRRLYRTRVSGSSDVGPIHHVPIETPDTTVFTSNPQTTRILYVREFFDPNIWLLDRRQDASAATQAFAPSTWIDLNPQFSRDGTRVAFESSRTGTFEIWTAREGGAQPVRLTSMGGPPTSSPAWSPDGRWIAFNSGAAGRSHVYVIESDGGSPRRLTADDEHEAAASWSFDGRWIYFSSNKAGSAQIWKIRLPERGTAPPGSAIQVTRNGGIRAVESWDGRTLYFSKPGPGGPSLWEMSLATGEEREVLPSLNDASAFAVFAGGIFFVPRTSLTYAGSIALLSFKDRSISIVAPVGNPILGGMTAHPTGRAVLYSQVDREESDLILSERVR